MDKNIMANNQIEYKNLAQQILAECKSQGATAAELALTVSSGLATNVRMREVETIEFTKDKSLGITVYCDKNKGSVATSDYSFAAIKQAITTAINIAKYTESDPFAGLAAKEELATDFPDLDLYHPATIDPQYAINKSLECEAFGLDYDKRIINSDGASFSSYDVYHLYANSNDFLADLRSTRYSLSCVLLAKSPDFEVMQRDYDYTVARKLNDLNSLESVGKKAAELAISRLQAKAVATCKVPVLFSAKVASSIWGHLLSAISGGSLYRKASFLLDSLNSQIFPEFLNISEDPFIKKGFGSRSFDSEGVATKKRNIVTNGKLDSYILSSYSARKLGLKSTGNAGGVHNLFISQDNLSYADLIKKMHRGLIVTEVMGPGVNIVTGDYSRGAAGFWVENGEIKHPVEKITISSNLREMFKNIQAVANDLDNRGNILTGSVLIDGMTVAGI